jgi:hypothetical protein
MLWHGMSGTGGGPATPLIEKIRPNVKRKTRIADAPLM